MNVGTSATVRLIEGVRLIRCPLNTGFTVPCYHQCLRVNLLQKQTSLTFIAEKGFQLIYS